MRARRSDHSSAQLASAQLARSNPNTGASSASDGTAAGTLTKGCGVFEAAAAEGLPAIAATTIKTMIAEPRFPDVFLAMSLSLSPQISTYVKWILRDHSAWGQRGLRPPSEGGNGEIHSIGGSATRAASTQNGVTVSRAQESKSRGITEGAAPSMAEPR
jgi:hypothetical protein